MARPLAVTARERPNRAIKRPRAGEMASGSTFEIPARSSKPVDNGTPCPTSRPADWERNAVDITRLDKRDPAQRRQINNAWRSLKAEAGEHVAGEIGGLLQTLRTRFPDAGIEVPAETLGEKR